MLVGHNPNLSEFLGRVISDNGCEAVVELKKGAVAKVEMRRNAGSLSWCITPRILRTLLAQRAVRVIAVDSSAKMIEVAREQALRHGVKNVDYRLGDMEELPIADGEVDLVWVSQSLHHALHPERALAEAWRILTPGGRIVLLDLVKHRFEEARELYADEWLGFSEAELESMLEKAGFAEVQTSVVDKGPETPQFQTLLAVGNKPRKAS